MEAIVGRLATLPTMPPHLVMAMGGNENGKSVIFSSDQEATVTAEELQIHHLVTPLD